MSHPHPGPRQRPGSRASWLCRGLKHSPHLARLGEAGLTLVDVMVGLVILAFMAASLFAVFLSAIAQARTSGVRGEAAAWVQSEVDYLRYVGYNSSCLSAGARTITATSTPCTPLEPPLPASLAQATVQVEDNIGLPGLKRITIQVSQFPGTVLERVVTYETLFK